MLPDSQAQCYKQPGLALPAALAEPGAGDGCDVASGVDTGIAAAVAKGVAAALAAGVAAVLDTGAAAGVAATVASGVGNATGGGAAASLSGVREGDTAAVGEGVMGVVVAIGVAAAVGIGDGVCTGVGAALWRGLADGAGVAGAVVSGVGEGVPAQANKSDELAWQQQSLDDWMRVRSKLQDLVGALLIVQVLLLLLTMAVVRECLYELQMVMIWHDGGNNKDAFDSSIQECSKLQHLRGPCR